MFISEFEKQAYKNLPNGYWWNLGRIKRDLRKYRRQVKKDNPSYASPKTKLFLVVGRRKGLFHPDSYYYRFAWYEQAVDAWKYKNHLVEYDHDVRIVFTNWALLSYKEMWELGEQPNSK